MTKPRSLALYLAGGSYGVIEYSVPNSGVPNSGVPNSGDSPSPPTNLQIN